MKRPLRGWRLILFARCEHASRADSDEWDGPVARDRWWAAVLHRIACGPCQREHKRMNWLRKMLASAPEAWRRHQAEEADTCLTAAAAHRMRQALADARQRD